MTAEATFPEWEIEEALAWRPDLLDLGWVSRPTVVARQRYLSRLGRYIDLLLSTGNNNYIIVELKADLVDDPGIVTDQVAAYRLALAEEMRVQPERIRCVLASPLGFSKEVLSECERQNVLAKTLDFAALRAARPRKGDSLLAYLSNAEQTAFAKTKARREQLLRSAGATLDSTTVDASVRKWVTEQSHDEVGLSQMAFAFKLVSARAPIMAHEIWTQNSGKLESLDDMWFWLFYSVLDRRANASTFVKAGRILMEQGIFLPHHLVAHERSHGASATLEFMVHSLETQGFPLSGDSKLGKRSRPMSILDAAKLVGNYSYDFRKWLRDALARNGGDQAETFNDIWTELVRSVYGVGPRIASQFIRGMVLKGPWQLPLSDRRLLERSSFNVYFAGPDRFCLVWNSRDYESRLAEFADEFLEGNKAIVSHVLWYVRKRYESEKIPACWECPMAGFCSYYLKVGHQRGPPPDSSLPVAVERGKDADTNLDVFLGQRSSS